MLTIVSFHSPYISLFLVEDICECKGDEGIGSRENDLIRNLTVCGRFIKLGSFWRHGCRADIGKDM
jgi:hypothetical protein